VTSLESLGVFHFGHRDQSCPLGSLECQLKTIEASLERALIVLPEAFNVPDGYYGGTGPTPSIKKMLLALSEQHKVAFVAGLIEEEPATGYSKGFNSCYLIDAECANGSVLLCQKRKDCWDRICFANPEGCLNPVNHRGVGIAALICNDFINCEDATRKALIDDWRWAGCKTKILCAPSCSTSMGVLITADTKWESQLCVAAANGNEKDLSFIRGKGFLESKLHPDERSGSRRPDGSYDDRCGYPYNEILLSHSRLDPADAG